MIIDGLHTVYIYERRIFYCMYLLYDKTACWHFTRLILLDKKKITWVICLQYERHCLREERSSKRQIIRVEHHQDKKKITPGCLCDELSPLLYLSDTFWCPLPDSGSLAPVSDISAYRFSLAQAPALAQPSLAQPNPAQPLSWGVPLGNVRISCRMGAVITIASMNGSESTQ
jgi:hypothetical protein